MTGTGQFTSVDPLSSLSRSRYSYAAGDPLVFSDPTGLIDWGQVGTYAGFGALAIGGAALCVFGGCEAALVGVGTIAVAGAAEWAISGAIAAGGAKIAGQMWMEGAPSGEESQPCPDELPQLDSTGKVHGSIPSTVPYSWTSEQMQELEVDLQRSIRVRKDEQLDLGEDGPHRARIGDEERLLRQIQKRLSGS